MTEQQEYCPFSYQHHTDVHASTGHCIGLSVLEETEPLAMAIITNKITFHIFLMYNISGPNDEDTFGTPKHTHLLQIPHCYVTRQ